MILIVILINESLLPLIIRTQNFQKTCVTHLKKIVLTIKISGIQVLTQIFHRCPECLSDPRTLKLISFDSNFNGYKRRLYLSLHDSPQKVSTLYYKCKTITVEQEKPQSYRKRRGKIKVLVLTEYTWAHTTQEVDTATYHQRQ